MTDDNTFDWGNQDQERIAIISNEVFHNRVYDRHGTVKEGDIVFDIGANCGAFTYSILNTNPKHVYCFEPSNTLIDVLKNNTKDHPVTVINKAIGGVDDDSTKLDSSVYIYDHVGEIYRTTTFKRIIDDYQISKIDFMKFDCEGCEYDIFTEENFDFITKNVCKLAGEWHFSVRDENCVQNFIKFRDSYLKTAAFVKAYDRYDNDVTEKLWEDSFLSWFEEFYGWRGIGQLTMYIHYK